MMLPEAAAAFAALARGSGSSRLMRTSRVPFRAVWRKSFSACRRTVGTRSPDEQEATAGSEAVGKKGGVEGGVEVGEQGGMRGGEKGGEKGMR